MRVGGLEDLSASINCQESSIVLAVPIGKKEAKFTFRDKVKPLDEAAICTYLLLELKSSKKD